MKRRHIVMGLGVIAAGWLALYGDKTPTSSIIEPSAGPVERQASTGLVRLPAQANAGKSTREFPVAILALQPREILFGDAQAGVQPEGLFTSQNWTPPPPPPPKPPPPPPPTAPALPFTYIGKKRENDQWEVYLARKEQTFIVQEKSVIEGMYRVETIRPPTLQFIYLPLSQAQTLNIGDPD